MIGAGWPESPGVRWLAFKAVRRDDLCPSPRKCPSARKVACRECGEIWQPRDLKGSEPCPACGMRGWIRQRCEECEIPKLDAAMDSAAGILLMRAVQTEAELDAGFVKTLDDLTVTEWRALQSLRSERARYERERVPDGVSTKDLQSPLHGNRHPA